MLNRERKNILKHKIEHINRKSEINVQIPIFGTKIICQTFFETGNIKSSVQTRTENLQIAHQC